MVYSLECIHFLHIGKNYHFSLFTILSLAKQLIQKTFNIMSVEMEVLLL